jgi:flagellar basal body-associated protein FliL
MHISLVLLVVVVVVVVVVVMKMMMMMMEEPTVSNCRIEGTSASNMMAAECSGMLVLPLREHKALLQPTST